MAKEAKEAKEADEADGPDGPEWPYPTARACPPAPGPDREWSRPTWSRPRAQWNSMDASPAGVVTDPGHRKLPEVLEAVKARLTYFPVVALRSHTMPVAL